MTRNSLFFLVFSSFSLPFFIIPSALVKRYFHLFRHIQYTFTDIKQENDVYTCCLVLLQKLPKHRSKPIILLPRSKFRKPKRIKIDRTHYDNYTCTCYIDYYRKKVSGL